MPNLGREKIQKLKEKGDIKKLNKILDHKDSFICEQAIDAIAEIKYSDERRSCLINALQHEDLYVRNKAAIALGEREKDAPVEELISAIENSPGAIMSLIKIGNSKAIDPIVNKLSKNDYNEMKSSYLDYINKYGAENKMVQSIAQSLGLPAQYAETNNVSCGESVSLVIRKLPGLMDGIPALSEQQILLEHESIRQKKYLRELLHGSPAEMKNKVKEQLTAGVNWLSAGSSQKKTSFNIKSSFWTVVISTNYIRGDVIISYEMILWRANRDNKEIYYLSVSGERNW